jgi:hypothetical protein
LDEAVAVAQFAEVCFEMQDAAILIGLGDQSIADLLDLE